MNILLCTATSIRWQTKPCFLAAASLTCPAHISCDSPLSPDSNMPDLGLSCRGAGGGGGCGGGAVEEGGGALSV